METNEALTGYAIAIWKRDKEFIITTAWEIEVEVMAYISVRDGKATWILNGLRMPEWKKAAEALAEMIVRANGYVFIGVDLDSSSKIHPPPEAPPFFPPIWNSDALKSPPD